jgi:L-histidine N-alpha-methyltransferase
VLEAAYDDALGVTAAFNRNLLPHLNRLLGSDFALPGLAPRGAVQRPANRASRCTWRRHATTVRWPGGERRFAAGERIHTENSYKWTPGGFRRAADGDAGFRNVQPGPTRRDWFAVFAAEA